MSFRDAISALAIGLVMSAPFIVEIAKSLAR